jgi:PucR C-terminal helix-turn-helix domain
LAFSPLDESADEIRRLSILGRRPPPGHLEDLRITGFLEKAIHARGVSVLEPKEDFRRRLCVSMRDANDRFLGLMWVQERDGGFSDDAAEIIESASHFAARLISNSRLIPQFQVEYVRQLIGLPIGPAPYDAFGLQLTLRPGTAISVAGFAVAADADQKALQSQSAIDLINFYATTFTADALTAAVGGRVYVVNPNVRAPEGMRSWTGRVGDILTRRLGVPICVGISDAVAQLEDVAAARADVDRILDVIVLRRDSVPATLADLRTAVLLQEVVAHLRTRQDLLDPRIKQLVDYDKAHDGSLVVSLQAYLLHAGDINAAAGSLHVHPNTLRYRIRRIRELTDLDLRDPATRFLAELNIRTWITTRQAERVGSPRPRSSTAKTSTAKTSTAKTSTAKRSIFS